MPIARYSIDTQGLIQAFAEEGCSFFEATGAYRRELLKSIELWELANDKTRLELATNTVNAGFQSDLCKVLKGIMLLRWPEAAGEWFKGA